MAETNQACACGTAPKLIFACSGAADVGQISDLAARKLTALLCHRSQMAASPIAAVAPGDAARLLGTEHFRRADVGASGPAFIDSFASATT